LKTALICCEFVSYWCAEMNLRKGWRTRSHVSWDMLHLTVCKPLF